MNFADAVRRPVVELLWRRQQHLRLETGRAVEPLGHVARDREAGAEPHRASCGRACGSPRTVARSNGSSPNCPSSRSVELVGLSELVNEPDDLVGMANGVRRELGGDDEVDRSALGLLEVEQPPEERLAKRPRARIPLEGHPDELDLVIAASKLVGKRLREDLCPAPLERNLRRADRDSHLLGSAPPGVRRSSSASMRRSRRVTSASDPFRELVDERQNRQVERPLLGRDRLDVPAHELAEHALHRSDQEAPRTDAGPARLLEWTLGGHCPGSLGPRPCGQRWPRSLTAVGPLESAGRAAHLLLQARENRRDFALLLRQASRPV